MKAENDGPILNALPESSCIAWLSAAKDLSTEIYGGKLNMREVPTETFVAWYQWRLATKPNTETGIPLQDFDIESALLFFEDDVKAANAAGEQPRKENHE